MDSLLRYSDIVGYGIGQYYDYMKSHIPVDFSLNYLCDARWQEIGPEYDHIEVISPEALARLDNPFVIIFSGNKRNYNSIVSMLEKMKLPYRHAGEIFKVSSHVSGKQLKEQAGGLYCDARGNRIEYGGDIEDSINIHFQGGNNVIKIGKNISIEYLDIFCGQDVKISIGNGTEIEGMKIFATGGEVQIGNDCLISYEVTIRNHDTHHIFDKVTGKRINYPGNIMIGNHVWIGYGAALLGSASIGDNSIVGTMAVTSSQFPKEVIIAGNPAKIIREQVCWSKDNTNYYNRESLEECLAKEAKKYF